MSRSWHSLLVGDQRTRALAAAEHIGKDLRRRIDVLPDSHPTTIAELALVFHYLGLVRGSAADREMALVLLGRAMEGVAAQPLSAALHGGLSGVAWSVDLLAGSGDAGPDDPCTDVDNVVLRHLEADTWNGHFDLISGLVGLGVYALRRRRSPQCYQSIQRIVGHLDTLSTTTSDGVAWRTRPELIPGQDSGGTYNLGVAHGVPGVVAFLADLNAAGLADDRSARLLKGGAAWLLAQRNVGLDWCFPDGIRDDGERGTARLAWCYGDPGVAVALLKAAHATGDEACRAAAVEVARHATRRPDHNSGVVDACLCHGASGVGHLFNRIYQATGDEVVGAGARAWYARTLAMQKPEGGIGGYITWSPDTDGVLRWIGSTGFLFGATGVALSLLAAASDVEPLWDELLLTGIEPGHVRAS